jgi:hypothetical protein
MILNPPFDNCHDLVGRRGSIGHHGASTVSAAAALSALSADPAPPTTSAAMAFVLRCNLDAKEQAAPLAADGYE